MDVIRIIPFSIDSREFVREMNEGRGDLRVTILKRKKKGKETRSNGRKCRNGGAWLMIIPGYSINPEKMPRWPLIRRGAEGRKIIGIVEKKRLRVVKFRKRQRSIRIMLRIITLAVLKGSIAVKHRPIKGERGEAEVK